MADHKWVALARFDVSAEETLRYVKAPPQGKLEPPINLTRETLRSVDIGCWTCEQKATPELLLSHCPGEPS